jgi:hypothetical protein
MVRPVDWSPLADADPVPGDPLEVAALGRRFQATAAETAAAAKRLRAMCTDEFWDSNAGAAFRQRSRETAAKLDTAHARYAAAALALGTDPGDLGPSTAARPNYAAALRQAQRLAERILSHAQAAARSQQRVMSQLEAYAAALPPGALIPDAAGHLPSSSPIGLGAADTAEAEKLVRQYNTAADSIAVYRAVVASAQRTRDVAAANASSLISGVINSDGLGDSWRDYVATFVDEHADLLSVTAQVAGQMATECVTLALKMGGVRAGGQFDPALDAIAGRSSGPGSGGNPADLARPVGYGLVVPRGWFRVDLRPGAREPVPVRLFDRQVREELLLVGQHTYDNGGLELYISPQTAVGFPLPASLVVTRTPPHDEPRVIVTPRRLADTLACEGGEVRVTDFPAGRAVRVRRSTNVTSLDVYFPVPDSDAYLMLSFATPLDELADAMVGLFDSITSTLHWTP